MLWTLKKDKEYSAMEALTAQFKERYGDNDIRKIRSPLRICPLGAHVDHQGGLVTGMALDSAVNLVYSPSDDGYIHIQSMDFPDEEYFHVDHVPDKLPGFWGNYIRGAVLSLKRNHIIKNGFKAYVSGKLPIGGLSSSAAVTTAYLMAMCDVNGIELSGPELVQYSHWIETEFIGLKNGILDQSANILSKDKNLLVVDCLSGDHELHPQSADLPEFEVAVIYSGVSKALIGTDYNNRVDECRVGGWLLQELGGLAVTGLSDIQLRNIPEEAFNAHKNEVPGRFQRRLTHYYTEQDRVRSGIEAWKAGNLKEFGRLMTESGESSVHQYQCGCDELTTIFNILKECEGVYGARFSGAGYRGACIAIIDPAYKDSIKQKVDEVYPVRHPEYKDIYRVNFCKTTDGASKV